MPSRDKKIGIMIPFYIYPSVRWERLGEIKKSHPSVPVIAVVNPGNGPGKVKDQNYQSGIDFLHSAGVRIVGYVRTSYGLRFKETVLSDMTNYSDWYHVDGIMFDEMSNKTGYESYYSFLDTKARRLGFGITVGNPGTCVPSSYLDTMDVLCIYERHGLPSISDLSCCNSGNRKSNFAVISYRVASFESFFLSGARDYVSWVYITDADLPNPYDQLPTYFDSEIEMAALE